MYVNIFIQTSPSTELYRSTERMVSRYDT